MRYFEIIGAGPYNTLYFAAILLGFAIAWREGRRRGWPDLPWLSLLALAVAGGVIGSKLFHFDLVPGAPGEKTILGGLLGGALALWAGSRLFRFRGAHDALVLAIPLGFALGRVGCFLVGCCFGHPTELAWGVAYAPGSQPYTAQLAAGLLEPGSPASLPVHPTQLYEAIVALALAAGVRLRRGRFRLHGSAALALGAGYLLARAAIEFIRFDAAAVTTLGFTTVQWTTGQTGLLLGAWLLRRERTPAAPAAAAVARAYAAPAATATVLLTGLLVTLGLAGEWFTPLERIALSAAALPAVLALLHRAAASLASGFAAPVTAAAVLVLPLAPDTIPSYPRSYFTGGVSAMSGGYETFTPSAEGCGGETLEHRYAMAGLAGAYTAERSPHNSFSVRVQGFAGRDRATPENSSGAAERLHSSLGGGAVSIAVDDGTVGFSVGAVAGKLMKDAELDTRVRLSGGLRVGSLRSFFVEGRVNEHEPAGIPVSGLRVGAGYGLSNSGSNVRVGFWEPGTYLTGTLVTGSRLEIEPFLSLPRDREEPHFGIATRWRFGYRPHRSRRGAPRSSGSRTIAVRSRPPRRRPEADGAGSVHEGPRRVSAQKRRA